MAGHQNDHREVTLDSIFVTCERYPIEEREKGEAYQSGELTTIPDVS